ncbi:uncharacterized protein LOC131876992 [Tigriopus californicus]|uniref:uncharacterized protein LOC131876992 n=1 Tax=Tigriopus californicus TaxID=6832 RepID=UPI0027DA9D35|nr:uncharacterized protein LOC131876992 [Tigriopus californicus]
MSPKGSLVAIFHLLFYTLFSFELVQSEGQNSNVQQTNFHRQKRLFSLFNVVQFQNGPCITASDIETTGTCLNGQECTSQGGTLDGNCASGFGVCCVFILTGCNGVVNQNCTMVRNMGFPAADSNTGRTCSVSLNRLSQDICQIRLDFQSRTVLPLGTGEGVCGGTGDSLNVISPHSSSQSAFPPTVCGTLTGQHMYFESGRSGSTAGQINIVQGTGANTDRRYNIKVSYIECDSIVRAPSGCTQYFTDLTGTITSYNFPGGQILVDQLYTNCIRQNEGFCSVQYAESPITTPDPFELTADMKVRTDCGQVNQISIPSSVLVKQGANADEFRFAPSERCGSVFGALPRTEIPSTLTSARGLPFVVNVRTRPASVADNDFSGFSLDYSQIPC